MKLTTTALIALAVQTALFSQVAPKLSLKLERMQGEGIRDQAVFVSVRVTNLSQQTVLVPVSAVPELDYRFTVVGPDGRPAPPTKDAGKHRRSIKFSNTVGPLKPGESVASGYFPMSDVLDFSRPGTYRITATRHYDSKTWSIQGVLDGTYTSDVLEVKVP